MSKALFGYEYSQLKEINSNKYVILKNNEKVYIGIEIDNGLEYNDLIKIIILKSDSLRKDLEEINSPKMYILN